MKTCFTFLYSMSILVFMTIPGRSRSQELPPHHIAVYEQLQDGPYNKSRHVIRPLFVKTANGWEKDTDTLPRQFRAVHAGKLHAKTAGSCCAVTYYHNHEGAIIDSFREEGLLLPHPLLPAGLAGLRKQLSETDGAYRRLAVFLTDCPGYSRRTQLQKYRPGAEVVKKLGAAVRDHIVQQLSYNKGCSERYGILTDSLSAVLRQAPLAAETDYENTYADQEGNKLVRLLLPAYPPLTIIYPFEEYTCWREDNGYDQFEVMCRVDKTGRITILKDLLRYLDHGDFDGDGKDEYLFWYTRFNRAGYIMFYDNFKRSVSATWTYH